MAQINKNPYVSTNHNSKIVDYEIIFGWTEEDRAMQRKLQSFIPPKVFDAHAHLHNTAYMPEGINMFRRFGTADAERFLRDQKEIYGERKIRGLLLPTPSVVFNGSPELRKQMNDWLSDELRKVPDCVGAVYVMPDDTKEEIEAMLINPQIRGFKCYHQAAKTDGPTWDARIDQYLPESAWQVADERGMTITLHMVRPEALADDANKAYILEMTARYPNAKLILAHCARGFASWTTIETVRQLKGIPNIYYDMAAICDAATMGELIRQAGVDRVMWGSDYCIDHIHAKPVNVGNSFCWLYRHEMAEGMNFPVCMTVWESLFAFYQASLLLDLSREEIARIFYDNACELFGIKD